jgi:hypothetical protein
VKAKGKLSIPGSSNQTTYQNLERARKQQTFTSIFMNIDNSNPKNSSSKHTKSKAKPRSGLKIENTSAARGRRIFLEILELLQDPLGRHHLQNKHRRQTLD